MKSTLAATLCTVLGATLVGRLPAQTYYTHPVADCVKTLQCVVDDDFMKPPVIDQTGVQSIEVSFDWLDTEEPRLAYDVVHCDHDWQRSDLSQLNYVEGFLPVRVDDVAPSYNTFTSYYHCSVRFPNDEVQLTESGNYAVVFHLESVPDSVVGVACFGVSEQRAFVSGSVSGNTEIDYRRTHQQLALHLTWAPSQLPYLNPADDVRLVVVQNGRRDTRRDLMKPDRIEAGAAHYEHQADLIFEAGNAWRRFEFTDERYAAMGVDRVRYHAPTYDVYLWADHVRTQYLYDADQKGHYLVHALRVADEATEADYFHARFALEPEVLPPGQEGIYLMGAFTYGERDERYRMHFVAETGRYEQDVMLKMGHYNYMYGVGEEASPADVDAGPLRLGPVEGNWYETPNEYQVWVYYHPHGARHDRLLGVATIQ